MASLRVYSTAIFVLLCTTICISNGKRGCKKGKRFVPHGKLVMMPHSCKVYSCDDSKWSYRYTVSFLSSFLSYRVATENNMAAPPNQPQRMSAAKAIEFMNSVMDDSSDEFDMSSEDEYNHHLSSESDSEDTRDVRKETGKGA
ncbi:hypothetical protein PoB_006466900 [Plakobranchus ocellatus]|uniref:Uncharacterized protein n=1 Tax=Plakobranchus ocellatus TaxID=259542 RepID=A0AAV4D205_9GAST|nr:hypothetical protein PoB_006466900 [Plakobranchus ocellatus]